MTPLDLDLATAGYIRSPDGHLRHVWGFDRVAAALSRAGVRVYWEPALPWPGYSYCWQRVILLSPALAGAPPWWLRRTLLHELAHCLTGRACEERVLAWQQAHYADLTRPPDWGAV